MKGLPFPFCAMVQWAVVWDIHIYTFGTGAPAFSLDTLLAYAIVHPSLSLYVKCVLCDKRKETCAHVLVPHERLTDACSFSHEEWFTGDVPFYMKFWAKLTHPRLKNADFQSTFARTRQTTECGTHVVISWRIWADTSHMGGMWVLHGFLLPI